MVTEPSIDTNSPSIARVYDACVGGKDNYEVDREVAANVAAVAPEVYAVAQQCRQWLARVVEFLAAHAEIDQFLDCGSGLPTAENTHQVAQRFNPRARVVYVDNDPTVAAHGRALLEENAHTRFVVEDLRAGGALLARPEITAHLDPARPLALVHSGTLHHLQDAEDPWQVMASSVDALPRGSYVAISHFHDPADGGELSDLAADIERRFRDGLGTSRFRRLDELTAFTRGLELVEPGWTPAYRWWPRGPRPAEPGGMDQLFLCAVARKP